MLFSTLKFRCHFLFCFLVSLTCCLLSQSSHADPFIDFIKQTKINGDIREYYFTRNYSKDDAPPNQRANSLGGMLNAQTATFWHGFQADAAFYTANPFDFLSDLNSSDPRHVDGTLPGKTVNVFGQAYLQYENKKFLLRYGYQLIKSPWLLDSDSRMIPATYEGIYAAVTPLPDFNLIGMRVFEFKDRISDTFSHSNLYNITIPHLNSISEKGTLAFGASYHHNDFSAQGWFYEFYDFAKMFYSEFTYKLKTGTCVSPIFAVQLGRETGDGKNFFSEFDRQIPNSDIYGALVGLEAPDARLTFAYNLIPKHPGAFHDGDLVSPYTFTYATDPLYTTSMIAGLVEKAAGDAFKVTGTYFFFQHQLQLSASYAVYYTAPLLHDTRETNVDIIYTFNRCLKGLSIRDRVGILDGNLTLGRFIYNRVMLQYNF